jgi:hypothetical protein
MVSPRKTTAPITDERLKQLVAALAIIAGTVALSDDASACYRFRVWHYPWPQRCGLQNPTLGSAVVKRAKGEPSGPSNASGGAAPVAPGDIAEGSSAPSVGAFAIPPGAETEDEERAWAIGQLRAMLSTK